MIVEDKYPMFVPNEQIIIIHESLYAPFNIFVENGDYVSGNVNQKELVNFLKKEKFIVGKIYFPDKELNELGLDDIPKEQGNAYDFAFNPLKTIWSLTDKKDVVFILFNKRFSPIQIKESEYKSLKIILNFNI